MTSESNYRKLFSDFRKLRIMIIGDVMVDSYLWGKVERISPEAPIPIVALRKREHRMGGAANVARNVRSMGATPLLCSVIGADEKGDQFLELLHKEKISDFGIIRSKRRITTTKFRIFGNNYQMLRVDEEVENELHPADYLTLIRVIDRMLEDQKVDCIIFQDYDKGVINPALIGEVVKKAGKRGIPVAVDPKRRNFLAYQGVTLFKPNLKELKEGMKSDFDPARRESLTNAAANLRNSLGCRYLLTTLSEHGVMMIRDNDGKDEAIFIPSHVRSVADVSGAGDTVISVASMCLAMKRTPYEVAYISNMAGGLVCEDVGVVPIQRDRLLKELLSVK